MRHRLLASLALGAAATLTTFVGATSAFADQPTTVTSDECFNSGGYFGGYNSALQAVCVQGPYDGIPMDHDPMQLGCPDGQHMVIIYLKGFGCGPDIPSL